MTTDKLAVGVQGGVRSKKAREEGCYDIALNVTFSGFRFITTDLVALHG